MAGVLAVAAVLILLLAWFFWPGTDDQAGAPPPPRHPDVDRAELEAAEREVQEAPDADSVRDWGPGTGAPPVA